MVPRSGQLSLPVDTVDIWLAFDATFEAAQVRSRFVTLMTAQERDRMQRFHFEAGRRQYALTRAMQREVLSAYAPEVAPAQWEFEATAEGRPFLASAFEHTGLHFNLSHTDGLVAMAVGRHERVGVDVEKLDRAPLAVAERYFSAVETAQLQALPVAEQPRHFVRLWTLKEAYLKAIGTGVAGGLGQMSIIFSSADEFRFECADDGDASRWRFRQFEIGLEHVLSLAVLPSADVDCARVTLREFRVD